MTVFRNLKLRNSAEEDHVLILLVYGFSRNSKCYYSEVTSCVYDRYLASFFVFVANLISRSNYVLSLSTAFYLVKSLICENGVTTQNL
jgi:hypothetical protein